MKYTIAALIVTVSYGAASCAFAEGEDLRGETFCFPAKDVPKLIDDLAKIKPERRDVVDVRLKQRFIIKDAGVWPDRFYLAKDGDIVTELPFSKETGAVEDFIPAVRARPDTDICVDDPTRAARPKDDEGLYFEMGLSPLFKMPTGRHDFAELKEGAADGKKFYKKMLPRAVAFLMPDTDYFAIRMVDRDALPTAFASNAAGEKPLTLEPFKDMWVLSLDDIADMAADALIIRGGAYDLQPVPSPKTLRRFGWGDATNED